MTVGHCISCLRHESSTPPTFSHWPAQFCCTPTKNLITRPTDEPLIKKPPKIYWRVCYSEVSSQTGDILNLPKIGSLTLLIKILCDNSITVKDIALGTGLCKIRGEDEFFCLLFVIHIVCQSFVAHKPCSGWALLVKDRLGQRAQSSPFVSPLFVAQLPPSLI